MLQERPKRDKESLNMEEAAHFLGIGICTLRKLCRDGKGAPPFRRAGRRFIFTRTSLSEWVATGGATQD